MPISFLLDLNRDCKGGGILTLCDNDIKYRYVKMQGKVLPEDIYRLENIFTYDRNKYSIRIVSRRVDQYEQLVKEQVEKEARARLNDEEARQLKQGAETIREKK